MYVHMAADRIYVHMATDRLEFAGYTPALAASIAGGLLSAGQHLLV